MPSYYAENVEKTNIKIKKELNKKISSSSQLNLYPVMFDEKNNEKFLNLFRYYEIDLSNKKNIDILSTQPYECDDNDWFDNISNYYYNIPELWWVVCLTNSVQNPFEEIEEGKLLHIINPQKLYQLYKEIDNIAELK